MPTLGVLPWLEHGLPDEDGAADASGAGRGPDGRRRPLPDRLQPRRVQAARAGRRRCAGPREPRELEGADLVVLPGSKHVAADLGWLRRTGLAEAVRERAAAGGRVLGICGGLQMLGERARRTTPASTGAPTASGCSPFARRSPRAKRPSGPPAASRSCPARGRRSAGCRSAATRSGTGAHEPTGRGDAGAARRPRLRRRADPRASTCTGCSSRPRSSSALLGERPAALARAGLRPARRRRRGASRPRRAARHAPGPVSDDQAARRPASGTRRARRDRGQRSLVLVNTGDGKGKSTAAFGVVMRGVARRWRVCVIQFIKSDKWEVGEEKIARQLGVEWLKGGDGFTWESPDLDQSEGRARAAWQLAAATIAAGDHQLVVLDEITYPMNWGWIAGRGGDRGDRRAARARQHRRHRPRRACGARRDRRHGHRDGQASSTPTTAASRPAGGSTSDGGSARQQVAARRARRGARAMTLVLILGGARSGKSELAVRIAAAQRAPVTLIATGEAGDAEMEARIEPPPRGAPGRLDAMLEVPLELREATTATPPTRLPAVDCLTLWTANLAARSPRTRCRALATDAAGAAAARPGPDARGLQRGRARDRPRQRARAAATATCSVASTRSGRLRRSARTCWSLDDCCRWTTRPV